MLPSPVPYVAPITLNSAAYVSRLTVAPLHNSHPSGRVFPAKAATAPTSSPSGGSQPKFFTNDPRINCVLHGQRWWLYRGGVAVNGVGKGRIKIKFLKSTS